MKFIVNVIICFDRKVKWEKKKMSKDMMVAVKEETGSEWLSEENV